MGDGRTQGGDVAAAGGLGTGRLSVGRYPLMESARAIAALCIVLYHAGRVHPGAGGEKYLDHLNIGVTIFFLISGFLLYRPFIVARINGERLDIGSYGLRRLLRIVPAYWVALTLVVLVGNGGDEVLDDPLTYYGFAQSFSDATLLQGIGQAWTLSSELIFYAALPLLALAGAAWQGGRMRWRREAAMLLGLALAAYVYTTLVAGSSGAGDEGRWELYVIPRFLGHFALGMGLAVFTAWLAVGNEAPRWLRPFMAHPGRAWWVAFFGYVMAVESGMTWAMRDVLDGFVAAAILWPAIFGVAGQGFAGKVLGHRWLLFIGTVSYGVYLYHYAVLSRIDSALQSATISNRGLLILLTVAGSVAVGYASFRLIERPAMRLARRRHGSAARGAAVAEAPARAA